MAIIGGLVLISPPAVAQSDSVVPGDDVQGDDRDAGSGMDAHQPGRPWVQGVPQETRIAANRIFLEANSLMREGLFARAAEKYREALALWDHPGFHYNLAIAEINLDQPIAAYESLQRAVRYGAAPFGPDKLEQAQSFLKLLRNQLAEIEVVCDEPGAVVTLDGKPLFTAPGRTQLVALPGGHQLTATESGRLPDTRQIVLAPGQRARFRLAPQLPLYLAMERHWPAWRPWSATGVGLIVVAAGGVINWRSSSAFASTRHDAERLCTRTSGCDSALVTAALRDQRDHATRLQTAARATYLVGGTILVGGAVLLYLNRERPVHRRRDVEVSLVPVLAPHVAGVSAHVRF
jgi:hypothetical protein